MLPQELHALVKEKLQEDYLAFGSDTATEDPKHFIARDAAAQQALSHLARLAELNDAATPDAEPSTDEVLTVARADIAHENKT